MSAPSSSSSSRIPRAARLVAMLAAGVAIAGCAAPGAGRLQGAPAGMPPSLEYVTADVLGFSLYATDPEADGWEATGLPAEDVLDELYASIGTSAEDVEPWIGDHAGIAVRQLDVPGTEGATSVFFADVRDTKAMLEAVEELEGDGRVVQAYEDAVIVARGEDELEDFLEAADEYAVSQRRAMREYAAEVATKVPLGAVFRFDLVRTHVRRPFQHDPALLELARWATESDVLLATRDGWVGVAAPVADDRRGDSVRLVGNVEWVPDLAEEIDWGSVEAELLDEVDLDADLAVAFEDPGQHLSKLVEGITRRNGQYATDGDVPEGEDRIELEPLLEQLDGDAVVSVAVAREPLEGPVVDGIGSIEPPVEPRVEMLVRDAASRWGDVDQVLDRSGAPANAVRVGDDLALVVESQVGNSGLVAQRLADTGQARTADAARAGKPPRPPIAWIWTRSIAGCTGHAAGWVTFDGEGEMSFSIDVALHGVQVVTAEELRERQANPPDCTTARLVPFA